METGFQNIVYAGYTHGTTESVHLGIPKTRYDGYAMATNLNRAFNNLSIGCRYILN